MAEGSTGFQEGYKPENNESLIEEMKLMNDTLGKIALSLNKTTNNDMFTKKDYLEKTLNKFGSTMKDTIYKPQAEQAQKQADSTKEFLNKTSRLLDQTSQYLKNDLGLKDVTKKQMEILVKAEKERLGFQKQMMDIVDKQDYLISQAQKSSERERQSKSLDLQERMRSSFALQPEERAVNMARDKAKNQALPEAFAQSFYGTKGLGSIFSGINQMKGGRSKDQFTNKVSSYADEAEKGELRNQGLYQYDPSSAIDLKDMLSRRGSYGEYSDLQKKGFGVADTLEEAEVTMPTDLKLARSRINNVEFPLKKETGYDYEDDERETPIYGEGFTMRDSEPKNKYRKEENADYSITNITASQVKRVLGKDGIGFIYLGGMLETLINPKEDKKDPFRDISGSGGGGGGGKGGLGGMIGPAIMSALPAIGGALAALLPFAITAAGIVLIGKAIYDNRDKIDWGYTTDAAGVSGNIYSGSTPGQKNAMGTALDEKKKEEQKGATTLIFSKMTSEQRGYLQKIGLLGTGKYSDEYNVEELRKKGAKTTDGKPLFHNGGIIGGKELIAQKGEVILPISESNYGMSSGILKSTADGGMEINKGKQSNSYSQSSNNSSTDTKKMESLLEQLLSAINTNLVPAVKENKPIAGSTVPSLDIAPRSYRS